MELARMYAYLVRKGDAPYVVRHFYESRVVWFVLKLIPRDIKKWVVVQSAVKASAGGSPDGIGYKEMHDVWARD